MSSSTRLRYTLNAQMENAMQKNPLADQKPPKHPKKQSNEMSEEEDQ